MDRPRDAPARVGFGFAGVTFFGVLWAAGGNDIIAKTFHIPLFTTTWTFRVLVIAGPVIAFAVSRRIALGLQRRDAHMLTHGLETGIIRRMPSGEYAETERPLTADGRAVPRARRIPRALPAPKADEHGVLPKTARGPLGRLRIALNRIYTADIAPVPEEKREERPGIEQ